MNGLKDESMPMGREALHPAVELALRYVGEQALLCSKPRRTGETGSTKS